MALLDLIRHVGTFLFSVVLHLLVAAPLLVQLDGEPPVEISGDGGNADAPSGEGAVGEPTEASEPVELAAPVHVSLYSLAPPSSSASASSTRPTSGGASRGPRGRSSDLRKGTTVVGSPRSGDGSESGDGVPVQKTRGRRNPCEKTDQIEKIGEQTWTIDREMVDYYASHLNEASKHAKVAVHRDDQGKRDGAKLYLSRCSLMKQGGMRNGDVVHTINGRKVQTVPQALSTYLATRDEPWVEITLTRQGEQRTHRYKLR